jgi:hypothetical protein
MPARMFETLSSMNALAKKLAAPEKGRPSTE